MTTPIRIALVDDEKLFLKGLAAILDDTPALEVVLTASNGREFLEALSTAEHQPEVALIDLRMAPMDGIETTHRLRESHPNLKVMILSTHYRDAFLGYMVKLGVSAFLPKNLDPEHLVAAIAKVHEKGLYFTEEHIAGLQEQLASGKALASPELQQPVRLTRREQEVLNLICDQHTSPEIAEKLFISIRTVEGHRKNLLEKTGTRNTVGLVVYAILNQLVDVQEKLVQYTVA